MINVESLFWIWFWQKFISAGVYGGGDGTCSQSITSTSPIFKSFTAELTTFRENCISQLSSADDNSPNYEKNLEKIYNKCTDSLLEQVSSLTEQIASAVGLSTDEVGSAILSESFTEPLICISSKISKVYSLLVSTIDKLNGKVKDLLGF